MHQERSHFHNRHTYTPSTSAVNSRATLTSLSNFWEGCCFYSDVACVSFNFMFLWFESPQAHIVKQSRAECYVRNGPKWPIKSQFIESLQGSKIVKVILLPQTHQKYK